MNDITLAEERRLTLQATCDAAKTQQERNRLGQFATPPALAADVLNHARRLFPADISVRFLDPGIGTGSFYTALIQAFPAGQVAQATGFEVDPHYGQPARTLWQNYPLEIHLGDFTAAAPPEPQERYNLIVCNPPYVRHHHMETAEKLRLQTATAEACGVRIGGLAGLYCHFMGLSHSWLADDGLAAWLVPSEFMDVKYGAALKKYLLHKVELLRIHRFDPNDLQFADAMVSSAVVWFRKRRPQPGHTVEFTYGGAHAQPAHTRIVPASALHSEAKWTRFPISDVRAANDGLTLADFFKIQRGLATGDNQFFIMTREQIRERNLPREFFTPILPGPRFVPMDVIEAEPDGTPKVEKQLFMLDCRLPEVDIQSRYPALWSYLETGKPAVSERYLCRYRSPWYSQENRPPALFMCTYMGRNLKRGRPIRFILNRSLATAANVYLMLYPRPALARALERDPELARKVWTFLNAIDVSALLGEGRVYGGGLYKMEPKELANVPADAIAALLPDERFTPNVAIQASLWGADEILEKRYVGYK
jgi:adenine-specific DNA-methyltransferase